MSVLAIKFRRDLRRAPGQLLAVVLLVLVGVALYGASFDAYRNLDAGYRSIFDRYRFADLTLHGGDTAAIAKDVAAAGGVAAVGVRTVADTPMRLPDGKTFTGRVVGMPAGAQPPVDRVKLSSGQYLDPAAPTGVLADKHLAPGASIEVWRAGAWQRLDVRGTVSSPEYLWPAPSRQDPLPAPGSFGVLFVPESLARQLAGSARAPNQVTVYYTAAGREDLRRTDAALAAIARRHGATGVVTRADQPSNALLSEDIKGFAELALMFPLLFLTAAGLATYVVLTRRVARDRTLIGMLRANGFRRRKILRHYLATGLLVGAVGSVLGVAAGLAAAGAITRLYTHAIGIPETLISVRVTTVAGGLAFGLAAGALSALAPALSAARVPPAEAMRGLIPSVHGGRGFLERAVPAARRLPAGAWLVLRGPARQPRRTLYTEIGVVLALVLVLVSWGMLDSSKATLARQFGRVQRQDASLTLDHPADAAALAALARTPGVTAAEPSIEIPASLGVAAYSTSLIGLRPGTVMHGFPGRLPANGALLGIGLREKLDVRVGDRVPLRLGDGAAGRLTVAGFVDEPMGSYIYATLDQVKALDPAAVPTTVLLRFAPGADHAALLTTLSARPGVVVYQDSRVLRQTVGRYLNLFYVFIAVMLVFGGLLAFTVLFATMSVNLAERGVELATLRANGVARRRLSRLVTIENLLLVMVGVVPGLILGRLATAGFLDAFNNDQLRFAPDIRPVTFLLCAGAVVVVALLAQLPGLRALARLDLGRVVRERAG